MKRRAPHHIYLLWASGADRLGIVAALTQVLYHHRCNLEDSSMMRLGSEFAVFLIFTSPKNLLASDGNHLFSHLEGRLRLSIGLKKISRREARFVPVGKHMFMIAVHGQDRPGIVYRVADRLARHGFTITDLATHRTSGKKPGYILFIEGELKKGGEIKKLVSDLNALQKKLRTTISINPISPQSI